jgi:hypothetical protein
MNACFWPDVAHHHCIKINVSYPKRKRLRQQPTQASGRIFIFELR